MFKSHYTSAWRLSQRPNEPRGVCVCCILQAMSMHNVWFHELCLVIYIVVGSCGRQVKRFTPTSVWSQKIADPMIIQTHIWPWSCMWFSSWSRWWNIWTQKVPWRPTSTKVDEKVAMTHNVTSNAVYISGTKRGKAFRCECLAWTSIVNWPPSCLWSVVQSSGGPVTGPVCH